MSRVPTDVISALKVLSDYAKTTNPETLAAIIAISMASTAEEPFLPVVLAPRKMDAWGDHGNAAHRIGFMHDMICRIYGQFSNDGTDLRERFHAIIRPMIRKMEKAYNLANTGDEFRDVVDAAVSALRDLDKLLALMRAHQRHFGQWAIDTAQNASDETRCVFDQFKQEFSDVVWYV